MFIFCILIVILISIFVLYLMTIKRKYLSRVTITLFFISGLLLLIIHSKEQGTESWKNVLPNSFESIFHINRMFSFDKEYDEYVERAGSQGLVVVYWLPQIFAIVAILLTLLTLFGRKFRDWYKINLSSYFSFRYRDVYIIKGCDKNAIILGEDIYGKGKKNRLIVFLLDEDDDENKDDDELDENKMRDKVAHFGGVVRVMDRVEYSLEYYLKKEIFSRIFKGKDTYHFILLPKNTTLQHDTKKILRIANEKGIKDNNLHIYLFTLSQWDKEKLEYLKGETFEKETINDEKEHIINLAKKYDLHLINEVELFIRKMIRDFPPYKCNLKFINGRARKSFTVMILGFGIVGQNALLHLIMNGQFVGSQMKAIIIDHDVKNLIESFYHRCPGLAKKTIGNNLCCNINYFDYKIPSKEFFTKLNSEINNIDYMIISTHDDELNKQTAIDIDLLYRRKGVETKDRPFVAVAEKFYGEYRKNDREIENKKIFIIGSWEDTYKEEIIIDEKLDETAKRINKAYVRIELKKDIKKLSENEESMDKWKKFMYLLDQSNVKKWNEYKIKNGIDNVGKWVSFKETILKFDDENWLKFREVLLSYYQYEYKKLKKWIKQVPIDELNRFKSSSLFNDRDTLCWVIISDIDNIIKLKRKKSYYDYNKNKVKTAINNLKNFISNPLLNFIKGNLYQIEDHAWFEKDSYGKDTNKAVADFSEAIKFLHKNLKNKNDLEVLYETEHLRWNAFHLANGWEPRTIKEMENICMNITEKDEEKAKKIKKDSRKCNILKKHICIAKWKDLKNIQNKYNTIANLSTNFKEYDQAIVEEILSMEK